MAEAIGGIASIITVGEFANKLIHLAFLFKNAPNAWQQYSDGLHAVECIQSLLKGILEKHHHLLSFPIKDHDGQIRPIVEHINHKTFVLRDDALQLLQRHRDIVQSKGETTERLKYQEKSLGQKVNKTAPGPLNKLQVATQRLFNWLKNSSQTMGFVLHQDQIRDLIEPVDRAQSHLHMVLQLISIESRESWQEHSGNLVHLLVNEIMESGKKLDDLKNDGKRMRNAKIDTPLKTKAFRPKSRRSREHGSESKLNTSTSSRMTHQDKSRVKMKSAKGITSRVQAQVRNANGETSPSEIVPQQSDTSKALTLNLDRCAERCQHDADDELSSENEETEQSMGLNSYTELQNFHGDTIEFDFIWDEPAKKMFQVPVDSEDYRHARGLIAFSSDTYVDHPGPSGLVRVNEMLESLPSEDWEIAKNQPMERILEIASSAYCTSHATDAETNCAQSLVSWRLGAKSEIFIAQNVSLGSCGKQESGNLSFCAKSVNVFDGGQTYFVIPPCSGDARCGHLSIKMKHGTRFSMPLSTRVGVKSLGFLSSLSEDELDHESGLWGSTIPVFPQCHGGDGSCCHTVVDNEESEKSGCVMPGIFSGMLLEVETPLEDSGDDTEQALSEPSDDERANEERFPDQPAPEDDVHAFELLQAVVFGGNVPGTVKINLEFLIKYIRLADKYKGAIGDEPFLRAKLWASSLRPSTSFDGDALAWLWIMWRLGMNVDFKRLSSTVQRQAKCPISRYQDETEDGLYKTKLPDTIIERLDAQRSATLTRVRDMMVSEMESYRQRYLEGLAELDLFYVARLMSSSLAYGYLQLECSRWLASENSGSDVLIFADTSFEDVRRAVYGMQNLANWKVSTLSTADRIPEPVAMISMFIPLVGAALHVEGLHGYFHTRGQATTDRLHSLIEELDKQDWGIDLDGVI